MPTFLKEKISLPDKEEVLKLHIIIKCFQKGIHLSEGDIDSLIELKNEGYGSEFYKNCVEKGFYKTEQTVRNAIGRMTALGILSFKRRGERDINKDFIPETVDETLIMQYMIGNL